MNSEIKVYGTVEIISVTYHQNPKNKQQNLWHLKVKDGLTTTFLMVPIIRDASVTKEWNKKLREGSVITFKAIVRNDKIVVTAIDRIKREATLFEEILAAA